MKVLLLTSCMLLAFSLNGQDLKKTRILNDTLFFLEGSYMFNATVPKTITNQKSLNQQVEIKKNHKINVLYESKGIVYYTYWIFNKNSALRDKYNKPDEVFSLPKNEFIQLTNPLFRRYKGTMVGVYTIPHRLRGIGGDFDYETSLSLQANLIAGLGSIKSQNSWIDLSLGLGLTGITLTPLNSDVTEQKTTSAFTITSGVVFKPSKFANIGVFLGSDNLGKSDRSINWKYNGELWIGLGINIGFSQINTTEQPVNNKTQE